MIIFHYNLHIHFTFATQIPEKNVNILNIDPIVVIIRNLY